MLALSTALAAAPARAQEAISVREVSVTRDGAAVAVHIATSGPPRWRTQVFGDPFRVVVELDGASYRLPDAPAAELVEPVQEIRGSQVQRDVARITIVLEGRADYAIRPDARGLRVVFTRPLAAPPSVGEPVSARGLVYGIVLREGGGFAYLWDPATRQTGVYKVGDAFAGGVVEAIEERRVVVRTGPARSELRLEDAKPR